MNPWLLIKAEWRRSRWGMLALALVLGLSASLGFTVSMLERGVRQGAINAGDAFDLLVGAPGSPTQLLLSTVYLQPAPLPLLEHEVFARLAQSPGVSWAAPLAFGDRWGDFPLVGTTEALVTLGGKRPLSAGVPFEEGPEGEPAANFGAHGVGETDGSDEAGGVDAEHAGGHTRKAGLRQAVAGALVPLGLGEVFTPAHGLIRLPEGNGEEAGHAHIRYRIVGRLPLTGTPWDKALLVPLESVWAAHGLRPEDRPGLSAVVVKPAAIADAYKLRAAWQTAGTQAVFTGEVLTGLFATLGDVRALLQSMAWISQFISLGGVLLATLFAVALRRDSLLLLRTLGAPRAYLMITVWSLAAGVIALGVLSGLGLAFVAAHGAATLLHQATSTALPVNLSATEWRMAGAFVAVGLVAAASPALTLYRAEIRPSQKSDPRHRQDPAECTPAH